MLSVRDWGGAERKLAGLSSYPGQEDKNVDLDVVSKRREINEKKKRLRRCERVSRPEEGVKGSGGNRKVCAMGWRKGNGDVVRVFLPIGCRVLPSLLRTRAYSLQKPTFCPFNFTSCSST